MSIKNYYGLKVINTTQFINDIARLRQKLINEPIDLALRAELYKRIKKLDLINNPKKPLSDIAFMDLQRMYSEEYIQTYLILDWFTEKNLVIPYIESDKPYKELLNLPSIIDYSYWNNSDKPDEISDAEWNQRETDWRKLINSWTAENNYTDAIRIEVCNPKIETSTILNVINTRKDFVIKIVRDYYADTKADEYAEKHNLCLFNKSDGKKLKEYKQTVNTDKFIANIKF